jgi:DNA-binding NtrC family response regulator
MANTLCIGIDDSSMRAKQSTLERAGHTVSLAKDVRQVIAACSGIRFDVILIGQTLPVKEKLRVYELIQRHGAGAKILEQYAAAAPELPAADAHIPVGKSGEDLVALIQSMVVQRKSA